MGQWAVSAAVRRTFFLRMMDCLVNRTAHRACSCVKTHTNVSHSGGSVMDKMTVATNRMNPKLVPSSSALRANFSAGTKSVCIRHRYVTERTTVEIRVMRRIATNMNVLKTNLNVQQMGRRMHFALHLTGSATKFMTALEARMK